LRGGIAAKAEAGTVKTQETRAAALQHLQPAAAADAEFGHATHPRGFAGNFGNVGPFATAEQFQREEKVGVHQSGLLNGSSQTAVELLRLNLNLL
jgi:hypothetical protein